MEDKNFWDELAKRLRQEHPQPFEEDDWAAVHRRLRLQRKRRPGTGFWALLAALVFLGNNLVWWLLWPETGPSSASVATALHCDTVYVVRELNASSRVPGVQSSPASPRPKGYMPLFQAQDSAPEGNRYRPNWSNPTENKTRTAEPESQTAPGDWPAAIDTQTRRAEPEGQTPRAGIARSSRVPGIQPGKEEGLSPLFPRWHIAPAAPARPEPIAMLTRVAESRPAAPARWLSAGAGSAWFPGSGASNAWLRHYGASVYLLPGRWGGIAGLRQMSAGEEPAQAPAQLGLPGDCATCPAAGNPARVRLHWLELQLGVACRLPLGGPATHFLLGATGQLRGPVTQDRHYRFDLYGGPPIEVDDHYREKNGLYWNGWTGSFSVFHRLGKHLAVSGSLEGRWPSGVRPRLTPPSAGATVGLAWQFNP